MCGQTEQEQTEQERKTKHFSLHAAASRATHSAQMLMVQTSGRLIQGNKREFRVNPRWREAETLSRFDVMKR
jgi:uncharacterized Fe-S cluster-containing MiaB family protein